MTNKQILIAIADAKRLSKWIASTDDSLESDETETVKFICDALIELEPIIVSSAGVSK
jgi:hypothetical protein